LESETNLRPGMSHTCEAGEKLIIRDQNGDEIEIEGRDDPRTIEFIESFDSWLLVKNKHITGVVLGAAFDDMVRKFNALPARIQNNLPSVKDLGVIVQGHSHA
jgi:hypothetical protein